MYTDVYGNVGFGWSYSLYVATQNEIDSLTKGPMPFVEWKGVPGTVGPLLPPDQTGQPDQEMPQISEAFFAVTMSFNGTDMNVSGYLPDLLAATAQESRDQFAYDSAVQQCGQNTNCIVAATAQWGPYLQYDRDLRFNILGSLYAAAGGDPKDWYGP